MNNKLSICITTFKEREEIVKTLISQIRDKAGIDNDIIVAVNGNNEEKMDDRYRKRMLQFFSEQKNCYPIFFPEFKCLSKIWNTLVIFSSTEYNLILNDDVIFENADIVDAIEKKVTKTGTTFFTINNSFSHFVITKTELHNLGYFDERLIAFGEEDGDMVHRYIIKYGRSIPTAPAHGLHNFHAYEKSSNNLDVHIDNKPRFNREFIYKKYIRDDINGIYGMSPFPVKKTLDDIQQYPYEIFFIKNKHNIKHFQTIINEYS
jgi:hypothetical protein